MTLTEARQQLTAAGLRLVEAGLVARSWGNLSLRIDDTTVAVTPSGIPWADLRPDQIAPVNLATGEWTGAWKPSGERKVHLEIYRRRPEVRAVIHTHQTAASAFAAARRPVTAPWGEVACAPYALPGTKKLTRATVDALGASPAVLLANHGAFTVGVSLDEAFARAFALERAAAGALEGPAPFDQVWDPAWVTPRTLEDGSEALESSAPFTLAWADRGQRLPALLDDLAQLAGAQVPWAAAEPRRRPRGDALLVGGTGALTFGPDAEALAQVVEKAARAAWAGPALGGARPFPAWEAVLMRLVYKNSYAKQAARR